MSESRQQEDSWTRVRAAGHSLELPAAGQRGVEPASGPPGEPVSFEGGDQAATLSADGVTVYLDASPFADPLTSYDDRPGAQRVPVTASDGREAQAVTFHTDDGTGVVAARLGSLTVAVHLAPGLPDDIGLRVLRSIREEEST